MKRFTFRAAVAALPLVTAALSFGLNRAALGGRTDAAVCNTDCCLNPGCPPGCSADCPPCPYCP
jgi:hypothetical protein